MNLVEETILIEGGEPGEWSSGKEIGPCVLFGEMPVTGRLSQPLGYAGFGETKLRSLAHSGKGVHV